MRRRPLVDVENPSRRPPLLDRTDAARLLCIEKFAISARTLESWPLKITYANGRALLATAEVLAYADKLIEEAARVPGGRARRSPRCETPS